MYFIKSKDSTDPHSLKYLIAILNSKPLKFWISRKGKMKGDVSEQFSTPIGRLPIRRIDFSNTEEVNTHNDLVKKTDNMISLMEKLTQLSKFFEQIPLNHLLEKESLPSINYSAVIEEIPPKLLYSLRTHPQLKIIYNSKFDEAKFILKKLEAASLTLEGPELKVIGRGRKALYLKGPEDVLRLIPVLLENLINQPWITIKELPLIPTNYKDLEIKIKKIIDETLSLKKKIEELQNTIDKDVCNLYDVQFDKV